MEELLNDDLAEVPKLTSKAMFGGWAWLVNGNLLCGARDDGMLVRLGKGNDGWALKMAGVEPMRSGTRHMDGWVRAAPEVWGNDAVRRKLLEAAREFVRTLRAK
ncbi:hypothetical protein AKJ09_04098 [Labilithrix luteola]|uniref:TfoX N-terminal domain-containing protein n=1 Tax=Labilithrix luteola TaxID=1391654 RepID=A0A0K1PWB6_9BACT|nr:hypothetical protein AKJ09_04098 [Labilithrix luteola]